MGVHRICTELIGTVMPYYTRSRTLTKCRILIIKDFSEQSDMDVRMSGTNVRILGTNVAKHFATQSRWEPSAVPSGCTWSLVLRGSSDGWPESWVYDIHLSEGRIMSDDVIKLGGICPLCEEPILPGDITVITEDDQTVHSACWVMSQDDNQNNSY